MKKIFILLFLFCLALGYSAKFSFAAQSPAHSEPGSGPDGDDDGASGDDTGGGPDSDDDGGGCGGGGSGGDSGPDGTGGGDF